MDISLTFLRQNLIGFVIRASLNQKKIKNIELYSDEED